MTPSRNPDPDVTEAPAANGLLTPSFVALIITEILSTLGQTCMVFVLPLHMLNISGSASLYGLASVLAALRSIILTPIGGALADRLHKQTAMAALDILSALTAFSYLLVSRSPDPIPLTVACMMLIHAYRSCYSPTVQSALRHLVDRADLTRASALVSQATSLVGMVGPVIAGLVMGLFGVLRVVGFSALVCLLSAFWILLTVRIPEEEGEVPEGMKALVGHLTDDMNEAARFLVEQRNLKVAIGLSLAANLILASYVNVALPYMVMRTLGLSTTMQGLAEGIIAGGGLLGAVLVSIRPSWFFLERIPVLLTCSALVLLPVMAGLAFNLPAIILFILMAGCLALAAGLIQSVSITSISYEQIHTPTPLIGKVIGLTASLCMCALPLGQGLFGPLIDHFPMTAIIAGVVLATLLICRIAKGAMKPGDVPVTMA